MCMKLALEEAFFRPIIQITTTMGTLADGFWLLKMETELPSSSTIWIQNQVSLSSNEFSCKENKNKQASTNKIIWIQRKGFDVLTILDGVTGESPVLVELSGQASNLAVLSTNPSIFVGFTADSSITASGFNASWTQVNPQAVSSLGFLYIVDQKLTN